MNKIRVSTKTSARLPTEHGDFQLHLYVNSADNKEHLALVRGEVAGRENVLVRVHSECLTGDIFGSQRCDCGQQLQTSLKLIAKEERGVLIYLRQEGRGIGLVNKLRAYNLQDQGFDTVEANLMLGHKADERDYAVASFILRDLGVRSVRLLSNNPAKIEGLAESDIQVTDRISLPPEVTAENLNYLRTKSHKMSHLFDLGGH